MTLNQAIEKYCEWGSIKYGFYTLRNYRAYLFKFSSFLENKRFEKIKLDDILKFQNHLKNSRKDITVFYYSIAIKQFFKHWFLRGRTALNPELIALPKYTSRHFECLTEKEYSALLKNIPFYQGELGHLLHLRDELIVKFLWASGVRVSELCDLDLDIIDVKTKTAIIITKKNREHRKIFWNDETNEVLLTYFDLRLLVAKNNFVFVNRRGGKLTTRSVQRIVEKICRRAGILKNITPHSFRHSIGLRAIKYGMNLRLLQELLGHKNLESSKIYMRVESKFLKNEYNKIFNRK